ncbi:hypothetical protein AB2N08_05765 [Massilia aurea]|uniref:hypothetical protein n=1 Tax=Massilia aurea TaxID=373040 RepID=UPI0034627CE4
MKTFTSGWAFQKPDQNYFKKFLHLNRIAIDGIVYPKKLLADIEAIPVLGFDDARVAITSDDQVLDLSTNSEVHTELDAFFAAQGIERVSIPDFLDRLIEQDRHDALSMPVAGIKASDIRNLKRAAAPGPFDPHFLDAESYETASKLDGIFRHSMWQRFIAFDRDDTPGNVLFHVLLDLQTRDLLEHLRVLDTPRVFLDAILKLRLHVPNAKLRIGVSDEAFADLRGRAEFYRRSLGDCLVPFGDAGASQDERTILLAGSIDPIVAAASHGRHLSAICFMPRSIVDYVALTTAFGERQYRLLLRQPDTGAHNLLAAVLTPALFGA